MFYDILKKLTPNIEIILRKAGRKDKPEVYLEKISRYSIMFTVIIIVFSIFILLQGISKKGWSGLSLALIPVIALVSFIFFLMFFVGLNNLTIINRKAALESDLLYSIRHLLLKIESGSPLLNALIDTAKLETKSSKFFGEIVTDIYLGTPIENAIEIGINDSPSKSFTKLLEEIKNSLKTGTDLEKSMKSTLEALTKEHMIQIKSYGKKLAPLSMMYMIFGTIVPALSSALLVLAIGFINLPITTTSTLLIVLIVSLIVVQLFFILFYKALKPEVMT